MGSSEVRFFKLNYEALISELREYAEKALEKGALSVILVGSLARGDYTAFSDADIIIIIKKYFNLNTVKSTCLKIIRDALN